MGIKTVGAGASGVEQKVAALGRGGRYVVRLPCRRRSAHRSRNIASAVPQASRAGKAITQSLAAQEGGLSIPLLLLTKPDSNENRRIGYPPRLAVPRILKRSSAVALEAEPDRRSVQEIVDAMEAEAVGSPPRNGRRAADRRLAQLGAHSLPPDFENDQGGTAAMARNYTLRRRVCAVSELARARAVPRHAVRRGTDRSIAPRSVRCGHSVYPRCRTSPACTYPTHRGRRGLTSPH